jgi:hypothetical protein
VKSKARAITQTGEAASSAYAMEWSTPTSRRRPRARAAGEAHDRRARAARHVADKNTYKVTYGRAFHQGATDAIDSFTHAVLGRSALSPETVAAARPDGRRADDRPRHR